MGNAHNLGKLLHVLQAGGWAEEDAAASVTHNFRTTITRSIQAAKGKLPVELMDAIGEIPATLTNEQWSDFWLGYYQARNANSYKDRATMLPERIEFRATAEQKAWYRKHGSAKLRDFIDAAIAQESKASS